MGNNTIRHQIALAFLVSIALAGRLSASLNSLVLGDDAQGTNPKVTLNPVDLYIKKNITDAGAITPLLDANTKKLRGVVSFDANGRLSQNRGVIFDRIQVGYQTHADADKEGALVYNKAPIGELYNADLVIVQDGREVFKRNVSSLINEGVPLSIEDKYADTDNLRYLKDDDEVEINLEFPNGVVMPAADVANQYIMVKLSGFETQKKELK